MSEDVMTMNKFNKYMKDATNKLKNDEFDDSYKLIMKAISENPNAPEPHNLLGIWYEFKGKNDLARKHYRIGYVLNPLYKPASVNLERVSTLFLNREIPVDFGDEISEDIIDKSDKKSS